MDWCQEEGPRVNFQLFRQNPLRPAEVRKRQVGSLKTSTNVFGTPHGANSFFLLVLSDLLYLISMRKIVQVH